jgi:NADPH-dependent curcumin reductase CurA
MISRMVKSREVHLIARPEGMPREEEFALVEIDVPEPEDGQVLVENLYLSVDPAMRPQLSVGYALNEVMAGGAIGRVIQSRTSDLTEGDIVTSGYGFRERFVAEPRRLNKIIDEPGLPITVHMHVLGGTGFTGYGGILHIAQLKESDRVFVSTAAGAVGSVAAQVAKIKGCYVIGSTGSEAKATWLRDEVGLDSVINYKETPINRALRAAAPEGIDVYFDNVGGDHLDAALARINTLGRIAVCGMISGYNEAGARTSVHNLANIIYGRINIRGFVVTDFLHLRDEFRQDMVQWLQDGRIKYQETILEGIENAPKALIGLLNGLNAGKMLVQVAPLD